MSRISRDRELLAGIHPVGEAIRAGRRRIYSLLVNDGRLNSRLVSLVDSARAAGIPVETVSKDRFEELCSGIPHQGAAAWVSPFPVQKAETVISRLADHGSPLFIMVTEGLEDPHNLGALIRTALCAGVDYIMIPKDRSVSATPSVSRASAGAMEHAPLYVMTNTASFLQRLKTAGFWIAGLDAQGDTPLFSADLTGNLALVLGGEHKGIRPLVKKECDFMISLPVNGVTSLNASVAGGIAMYEALRQRSASAPG